jgi:signal transduction histidine kinase
MIFHEAINNSVKYSNGTEITLNASLRGKLLTLQLIDNGKGFNVEKITTGNGLKNMSERAHRIGGRLTIFSDSKNGTKIEFTGKIS